MSPPLLFLADNHLRWSKKHPLHVSANSTAPPPPSPASSSSRRASLPTPAPIPITADSYIEPEPSAEPQASFTVGLAMLLYNVCYLAYTQTVEIPLNQAGDVLSNLWSICCSTELGRCAFLLSIWWPLAYSLPRHSHKTTPYLAPPTPATFSLDFAQLLQATTSNPASRSSGSRRTGLQSAPTSRRTVPLVRGAKVAAIAETEEDGWDMVYHDFDDDGLE